MKRSRDMLPRVDQPSHQSGSRVSTGPFNIEEPIRVAFINDGADLDSGDLAYQIIDGRNFDTGGTGDLDKTSEIARP